jgi:hypothetical protein
MLDDPKALQAFITLADSYESIFEGKKLSSTSHEINILDGINNIAV